MLGSKVQIKKNALLHGTEKSVDLDKFLMLKNVADFGKQAVNGPNLNLAFVTDSFIRQVHAAYGPQGLFQLMALAMAHKQKEFLHFIEPIQGSLLLEALTDESASVVLQCDNARLPQSRKANAFNFNVMQPSLARKLYRAGRHDGSLVYGLGGPRILVSHPFQGRTEDIYDLYANSVDVVTSLQIRGYSGTFHLLDYLPGLNYDAKGVPAWVVWFSIISVHSDLVIYVKEYEGELGPAQQLEIQMTPDRVPKKIVEIPHDELKWAKKSELPEGIGRMYLGRKGKMTEEELAPIYNAVAAECLILFVPQKNGKSFPPHPAANTGTQGLSPVSPSDTITRMSSIERKTRKALADVEKIHSFVHPLDDADPRQNLYMARSRREDAVRVTVLQMSLAIEGVLDSLFARVFVGHDPNSKRKAQKGKIFRELEDLLEGRMGFEAKLKLARVLRLITKGQQSRLDRLRSLRNRCAHAWMLDVVGKRRRGPKPTKRLLEYEGRNLFDLKALQDFMGDYSGIYLKLFEKYLS